MMEKNIFSTDIPTSLESWGRWKVFGTILVIGIPLIIGELGSIAQQYADTMMVGHYNTTDLAASGFINSIFYFVIFFVLGMSYASTPVISGAYGEGNFHNMTKAFHESILLNLVIGVFFLVVLFLLYFNLDLFNQPKEIMASARPYLIMLILSVPFMSVFYAFKQYLDAMGRTTVPMLILLFSNLINVVLNWFLIFEHGDFGGMGLFGAGIATLISRIVQLVWIVVYVFVSKHVRLVYVKDAGFTLRGAVHQFKLGYPISIQLGLEIATFNVCAIYAGWLGVVPLAAHQAMYTISTLCFQVLYGIGAAGCIIIGQLRGKSEWFYIRIVARYTFYIGLMFVAMIMICLYLSFDQVSSWFTNDAAVVRAMYAILPCFVIYQLGDCLQITYANALRGIEATKPLMYIAFISYVPGAMLISYVFTFLFNWNIYGIWFGVPFGLTLAGLLFCCKFRKITGLLLGTG